MKFRTPRVFKRFLKQVVISARKNHMSFDQKISPFFMRGVKPHLFNLDLHISVTRDLKVGFSEHNAKVTQWSISGSNRYTRKIYRVSDPVKFINAESWQHLDSELIRDFLEEYSRMLRKYDGFIVTHTPSFMQIFQSLSKPILVVNSTRYEAPFSGNPDSWKSLNNSLKEGLDSGKLLVASNNRGDANYLKYFAGIDSKIIPSVCDYTNFTYKGHGKRNVIMSRSLTLENLIKQESKGQWVGIREVLGNNFKWKDFHHVKEIFVIPYNISTMSLFELATAGVPVVVPSKKFLRKLVLGYEGVLSELSYFQVFGLPVNNLEDHNPNNYQSKSFYDWWLNYADFYDSELMPNIRIIDSLEELWDNSEYSKSNFLSSNQLASRNAKVKSSREKLVSDFLEIL